MKRSANILVVDDSESMRVAIKEVLKNAGYKVTEAENGKVALLLARENQFDLVITDIKMPVMGGIEFIKELRDTNKYQSTPVMTLASSISPQEIRQLRNANIMSPCSGEDVPVVPIKYAISSIH